MQSRAHWLLALNELMTTRRREVRRVIAHVAGRTFDGHEMGSDIETGVERDDAVVDDRRCGGFDLRSAMR
jgi:hypothetical protein